MRLHRPLVFFAALALALAAFNRPAAAITQAQWTNVCTNFIGLRSGSSATDTNGAGYGMDDGNAVPMNCLHAPPNNWATLLTGTLTTIKGFDNSGTRYLLIVGGCTGLSRDYAGAFKKCNSVTGNVLHATPETLSHYTVPQLATWVLNNI